VFLGVDQIIAMRIEPGTEYVETLPRFVRSGILLVLRQVEPATRRLVYAETEGMEIPEYVPPPKRMVREIAKRRAVKPGPASVPPLRYAFPPGHRKCPIHEVDGICTSAIASRCGLRSPLRLSGFQR